MSNAASRDAPPGNYVANHAAGTLAEHLFKIDSARSAGGYTSSLEREVKNFRQLIAGVRTSRDRPSDDAWVKLGDVGGHGVLIEKQLERFRVIAKERTRHWAPASDCAMRRAGNPAN